MVEVRIQAGASRRIDGIYAYTRKEWDDAQAEKYINGLFAAFEKIATHGVISRPIPADFGIDGFFFRYECHYVYWRYLPDGDIGIVTVLHESMDQIERFMDDSRLG